jgi:hypothetical protein
MGPLIIFVIDNQARTRSTIMKILDLLLEFERKLRCFAGALVTEGERERESVCVRSCARARARNVFATGAC